MNSEYKFISLYYKKQTFINIRLLLKANTQHLTVQTMLKFLGLKGFLSIKTLQLFYLLF